MSTEISKPDQHFNVFYEDNALLIQFMIVEFIQTYELTLQLKNLIQTHVESSCLLKTLSTISHVLGQLVGHPHQEKTSLARWSKGSLTKFKEYCELFSRNSLHQNKQHVHLHMAAHQTWLTAVHHLELLHSLQVHSKEKSDVNFSTLLFNKKFHVLHTHFNRIIRCIPKIMLDYWNNENVVLFILRKKPQFSAIYGSDFLHKRFKCPTDRQELFEFIKHRYRARGFETLLPTFQHLFDKE